MVFSVGDLFSARLKTSFAALSPTPYPLFFVSVADKGLRIVVSGLESTVMGGCVSVDSKKVCRL
jgi:hypothetical protein